MNNLFLFSRALEKSDQPLLDSFSLDNSVRAKCNQSFLYSIFHFKQKSRLDALMQRDLQLFFKIRYGFDNELAFKKVWNQLVVKIWTTKLPVTVGTLRSIDAAFQQSLIYHGPGIPPAPSLETTSRAVHQAVKNLLHGGHLTTELLNTRVFKAVFVNKDQEFLDQMRGELQNELNHLGQNPPATEAEELLWRAFLGNVLSLLPFTYPDGGETIVIPVLKSDGSCIPAEYSTHLIYLEEDESSPLKALGLTPVEDESGAPPILAFSGTTYPAGEGYAASVMNDFTPGRSVGKKAYLQGRKNIDAWMEDKKDVHVLGVSLGGALSLHALRYQHEKIIRVDAYNPPGLYPWDWKQEYNTGCQINIYCQDGDSVSPMGAWPIGSRVSLYHLVSHQKGFVEGPLTSHTVAYTGLERLTIVKKDPKVENKSLSRKVLTFLHFLASPFVYLSAYSVMHIYRMMQKVSAVSRRAIEQLNACLSTGPKSKKKARRIDLEIQMKRNAETQRHKESLCG